MMSLCVYRVGRRRSRIILYSMRDYIVIYRGSKRNIARVCRQFLLGILKKRKIFIRTEAAAKAVDRNSQEIQHRIVAHGGDI